MAFMLPIATPPKAIAYRTGLVRGETNGPGWFFAQYRLDYFHCIGDFMANLMINQISPNGELSLILKAVFVR